MKTKLLFLTLTSALGCLASGLSGFQNTNLPEDIAVGTSPSYHHIDVIDNELYAATYGGIFKYSESDNSWSCWDMEGENVVDFKICGDAIVALTVPKDESGNWNTDSISLVRYNRISGQKEDLLVEEMGYEGISGYCVKLLQLAQHPKNPKSLLVASSIGVWMSEDFGTTWTNIIELDIFQSMFFLGWHPMKDNVIFFTTYSNFYEALVCRSDDNGVNWEIMAPDESGDNTSYDIAFDPNDADHLLYSGQGCIFESKDCGDNWHYVLNNECFDAPYYLGNIYNIMYDPQDANTVFAVGNCNSPKHICMLKSTDSGATWTLALEAEMESSSNAKLFFQESILFNGKMYIYTSHGVFAKTVGTVGIESVSADADAPAAVYDLQGRRVDNPAPGRVYISQGKKYIARP